MGKDETHAPKPQRCPICGKQPVERYRPFCSARCADVDLHRWLGGRYAIPALEPPDFEEAKREPEEPASPRRRATEP